MAHQSGIRLSPDFIKNFASTPVSIRGYVLTIQNEAISHTKISKMNDWKSDLNSLNVISVCFILFRKDEKIDNEWEWILFVFVPDNSAVRDKMIYASSKGAILKDLKISHVVNASLPKEVSLDGWEKFVVHSNASAPLTAREIEIEEMKSRENTAEISIDARSSNAPGLDLKSEKEVSEKLTALKDGETLILDIDLKSEMIHVAYHGKAALDSLDSVATKGACFVIHKPFFVFVSPPSTPIKQRMVYAASKQNVVQMCENGLGKLKGIEVDSVSEIHGFINRVGQTKEKMFKKPCRPGKS